MTTSRRIGWLVALIVAVVAPLAGQQRVAPYDLFITVKGPLVALTHVRVVDGTGAAARPDQTVVLDGGKITAVGPFGTTRVPQAAQVLDLPNHTVIPGIVGLHEHTYFAGVQRVTQMTNSAPLAYLAYGVTTAMTAGSMLPYHELSLKRAVDARTIPGPRFLIAGPYLDGPASTNPMSLKVATPEAARRAVAYWAGEGATWVKFLGRVTREVLQAGIQEAKSRGMRVTGHLCSVTFSEAAAMGIDLLQHGFITNSEYVPGKKPDECPAQNQRAQADVDVASPAVQASIRAIVQGRAAVASTLAVYETFVPGHRLDIDALQMLDEATRVEVQTANATLPSAEFTVSPQLLQKMMAWERAFVAAGGLLGAGVDPWGTGMLPGVGNLRNYELLVKAGFTAEQAVQIMTLNGARILGEEQRIGSIAVGKAADLVVIFGDPVGVPSDVYNVVTVFKDGVGFDSAQLRQEAKGRVGLN